MPSSHSSRPLRLPRALQARLEVAFREQLQGGLEIDFSRPPGEPALAAADSISWQVFSNPVSLFIGGITAVLLELAEPQVRSGVWDHTSFRTDPMKRMQRTGLAAMVTVYGARSIAEPMIAGVRRMHDRVQGTTPQGIPYRANDPVLLRWVHATASFGFLQAYHRFVRPLPQASRDRFYAEGAPVAELYGADAVPGSEAELNELFEDMRPRLERSEIVFEFLQIMRGLPLLPRPFGLLHRLMILASIELLPAAIRETLGLDRSRLPPGATALLRGMGSLADRLVIESSPASQACQRLDLPADFLQRR